MQWARTHPTSTLPRGQLRAGLPATSSIYNNVFGGWSSIGNPYDLEAGYLMALGHPVNTATDGTGSTIGVTAAERHTVALLIAMGAHYPGQRVESKSPDPIHNVETWELGTARVSAEGASSARFNTVTALGIAVEPIVQGPRDSSGGTSGTLGRFAIPKGTQVGDAIAFEHPNPVKVSVQRFVGQDIPRLTFRLVDQYVHFLSSNPEQNALRTGDPKLLEVSTMRTEGCGQCANDGLAFPPSSDITRWGGM